MSDHSQPTRRLRLVQGDAARLIRIAPAAAQARLVLPGARAHHLYPAEGAVLAGRYRLLSLIGKGGIGAVYRAEDRLLHMPVAVKVLAAEFARDPDHVAALKAEAKTAMALAHPNIVRLHTLHEDRGRYLLVMELVEGRSLRAYLQEYGHFEPGFVTDVVDVLAGALHYAHGRGLLHNDLKPDNLLLTADGVLKVVDFGLAALAHAPRQGPLYGTPEYMSPERLKGLALDARSDIYGLGMTAYELLTGRLPFPPEIPRENRVGLVPGELTGVSAALCAVLSRAIAQDPGRRQADALAFAAEFAAAAAGGP